ncbi:MAG: guanylate kinase [Planctomycetes bacterium]|nr:guanylate kinase [Planctomycetota bacterium]
MSPAPFYARIVILSGPSGSGKTTIVNRLIEDPSLRLMKAVSATTRPARTLETDGEDYHFLSPAEFEQKRQQGEFLECAEVHGAGHWYGTLRSELKRACEKKFRVFLEIDVQGALNVMKEYPDAVTIFLTTPSQEEYERRLRGRGTETEETIRKRLQTADSELILARQYQHLVVNDDLGRAVGEITVILSNRGEKS